MKNRDPLVSVIMNCHNGEKYLEQSVKSVITQSYKNWELIFWDNVSKDNSKKIIDKFSDNRIKYFKSKSFNKLYESRNLAIKKANGKYITFLDTDDVWQNDKIKKQTDFLSQNKDFEIVYSNYYILDENKDKKFIKFKNKLDSGKIFKDLLKNYTIGLGTVCLNKDIFADYSFNDNFDIIGDFDFFLRLSEKKKIGYIHDPLFIYRLHYSNLSRTKLALYVKEIQNWIEYNKGKIQYKKNLKHVKFYLLKLKFKSFFSFFFK